MTFNELIMETLDYLDALERAKTQERELLLLKKLRDILNKADLDRIDIKKK